MILAAPLFGVWKILLPPQLSHGARPTLLLDLYASGMTKSREMVNLLSSHCIWQPKMPTEAAGEGGFGLSLCMAT